jgi:hypothetical protein
MSTLVELIEIKKDSRGNYMLNTIYVNPNQIVFMQENRQIKQQLQEGKIGLGLNQNFTQFTDIRMNFSSYVSNVTVVGDPGLIETKIQKQSFKQLLRD